MIGDKLAPGAAHTILSAAWRGLTRAGWIAAGIAVLLAASPAARSQDLKIGFGPTGLTSLSYGGHDFVGRASSVKPVNNTPRLTNGSALNLPVLSSRLVGDAAARTIETTYAWGVITASYRWHDRTLAIDLTVRSTTDRTIAWLDLLLVEIAYPSVPDARFFDAGMFGTGGGWGALHRYPHWGGGDLSPGAVLTRYEDSILALALDRSSDLRTRVAIPYTTNSANKKSYPLIVGFGDLEPAQTWHGTVSLRFAPAKTPATELVGDVLAQFRNRHPMTVNWPERAPIGALFLATSQAHPPTNPRGWFTNARDVDTTTAEGLVSWRRRLLQYADASIKILKNVGAQGMIVWDPEGEEFASATYYGDPRLTARLAPETEFKGESQLGALDEFFAKFRGAGLRVGVTLRPQKIEFQEATGTPTQTMVDGPLEELSAKVAYARKRWDCTIFYVDSTYDKKGALDPAVMRTLAARFPDTLLLPENETLRYFAHTAPLNSFQHHGVAGTPASVLEVYPDAFSTILMSSPADKLASGGDALRRAIAHGDIMIFNAWYGGAHVDFLRDVRATAGPFKGMRDQ